MHHIGSLLDWDKVNRGGHFVVHLMRAGRIRFPTGHHFGRGYSLHDDDDVHARLNVRV